MTNNQTKCGIVEKMAMQADDDKGMINYEWPNLNMVLNF